MFNDLNAAPFAATRITAPPATTALTEAQNGLWYAQRLDAGNPSFNAGHVIRIEGPLDVAAFTQAVRQTLRQADGLSMRFVDDAHRGPRQFFDAQSCPSLHLVDLQTHADPDAAAQAAIARDQGTPRDPCSDALCYYALYVLAPDRYWWYQRVHHLLADAYGLLLIENRIAALYASICSGTSVARNAPLASYREVIADDAAYQASPQYAQDRQWWVQTLQAAPTPQGLAEGAPNAAHTWIRHEAQLSMAWAEQLKARAEAARMAWPDLLTIFTSAYIARHTGEPCNVVGVPFMGRMGHVSARVPCMTMNVLPVPLEVDEDAPLEASLPAMARLLRQARRHGRYRSELVRRDLNRPSSQRRLYGPLINVLPFDAPMDLPGLRTERHVLCTGPVDDLSITFRANAHTGALLLTLDANPSLYTASAVQAHWQRLEHFLRHAVQAPALRGVSTLTPAETRHWLYEVNATSHAVASTTLTALMQARFVERPQAIALEDDRRTLRYAELDACTAALAQRLQAAGVQRGDIVAVMLPRSMELVLALVAILRCGAAYLPLDAAQPPQRLTSIARSARPRLAVCAPPWQGRLPADIPQTCFTVPELLQDNAPARPWNPPSLQASDAAYIIYTSGSTGTPKGVVVEHDAIVNRLEWMRQFYHFDARDRILQKTPATFDVSVWEFFLPFITGCALVVAPPDAHKDPAWLLRIMRAQRISTMHMVPSMLAALLNEPELPANAPHLALKRMFCSGEALPAALRDQFHRCMDAELHNLYGPTEAAVDVSYWPASASDASVPVPIGYPVWNTALYVLDARLRPVPAGVGGKLYLAGRQLARGYLGRDDLTAERFVPNPFTAHAPDATPHGPRMYDTGDLARWREDGAVVYLGRSDHQIKIRGQRVELEEIENVLAHAPGVDTLAVIAREDTPGNQYIVAYIATTETTAQNRSMEESLRTHAAQHLPDYMVPAAWVFLPALPVTANGKLDRRALPAPQFSARAQGRMPSTPTEKQVAALYQTVLHGDAPAGADDNFFDLGGHSLLATRLMALVRQTFAQPIGLGALFEHPTVARLAAYLDSLAAGAGATAAHMGHAPAAGNEGLRPVITLQPPAVAPARNLPALFCVHPAGGLGWCYGALGRTLQPATPSHVLPVHGLQARTLHAEAAAPATLREMARDYADTLQTLQASGPYHIAGWSVGGIIAQAMAVELQSRAQQVGALVLLDAYPADIWRNRPEPEENAALKALLLIAGHDLSELRDVPLERHAVIAFLRQGRHPLGELSDSALQGVIRTVQTNNRLVRAHHHTRYQGAALFFKAALEHSEIALSPALWQPYVDTLQVHSIASIHAHLTGPAATQEIARILRAHLLAASP